MLWMCVCMYVCVCCSYLSYWEKQSSVLRLHAKRSPVTHFFPPRRSLHGLEVCMLAKRHWVIILCSLKSPVQSSLPSFTLIKFWLHISLEKTDESIFDISSFSFFFFSLCFLLGVNISWWKCSFGSLNNTESQCLISKGVTWKFVNAVTKWQHSCIFFQSEPNFAWQIFLVISFQTVDCTS